MTWPYCTAQGAMFSALCSAIQEKNICACAHVCVCIYIYVIESLCFTLGSRQHCISTVLQFKTLFLQREEKTTMLGRAVRF